MFSMHVHRRVEPDSLESSAYISIELFEPRTVRVQRVDDEPTVEFDRADDIDIDIDIDIEVVDDTNTADDSPSVVSPRHSPRHSFVEVVDIDLANVTSIRETVERDGTTPFTRPYALLEIDAPPPEMSASMNLVAHTMPVTKIDRAETEVTGDELSSKTIAIVSFVAFVSALGIGLGASLLLFGA